MNVRLPAPCCKNLRNREWKRVMERWSCLSRVAPHRSGKRSLKVSLRLGLALAIAPITSGQQPAAQPPPTSPSSAVQKPTAPSAPTPQASPQSTPFVTPALPGPSAVQTPAASATPSAAPTLSPPVALHTVPANLNLNPLTLDEALRLANAQASNFQQAGLNEQIAGEDVRQAKAAFLPRVT